MKTDVVGIMDVADYYGPLNVLENILNFLDRMAIRYIDKKQPEMAEQLQKAGDAIEEGNLPLADALLVSIFKEDGTARGVYYAIAYVRDLNETTLL